MSDANIYIDLFKTLGAYIVHLKWENELKTGFLVINFALILDKNKNISTKRPCSGPTCLRNFVNNWSAK